MATEYYQLTNLYNIINNKLCYKPLLLYQLNNKTIKP